MNPIIRRFAQADDTGPIQIVYHEAASIITTLGQFAVTCPDPTPYIQAGDLVLYSGFVYNGSQDSTGPNNGLPVDSGNTQYYAQDASNGSRPHEIQVVGRRIEGGETIAANDRKFSYYASFIESIAIGTTLVIRGLPSGAWNAGLQAGTYTPNEFGDLVTTMDGAVTFGAGNAPERSVVRANAKSLAIAQHFTVTSGSVGPAPAGWDAGLQYSVNSGARYARVFGEYRYFESTGTTTTVARNPRPTQGNHATLLMHVFTD